MLESIRADTLTDLQRYYRKEMGLSDFSARLGNLMTICHTVMVCFVLDRAEFEFSFSGMQFAVSYGLPHASDTV